MSAIEQLVLNYERFVSLPWQNTVAHAQRVWMAVYPPEHERRLRLHVMEFENATQAAGFDWELIDITNEFEIWMAEHEYREAYFANPRLMQPELVGFFDHLANRVRDQITDKTSPQAVIGILGAGSLFGLGEHVKVSALIERVQQQVLGRLLVFFPGQIDGNMYRLLGARDGWNYLATPITTAKGAHL